MQEWVFMFIEVLASTWGEPYFSNFLRIYWPRTLYGEVGLSKFCYTTCVYGLGGIGVFGNLNPISPF